MALKTQYQPYGLPGKIRTFAAKEAAVPSGGGMMMLSNHFNGGMLAFAFLILLII